MVDARSTVSRRPHRWTYPVVLAVLITCALAAHTSSVSATPSCPTIGGCPIPAIPLHQPLTSLCGSGIGTSVTHTQLQDGVTFCSDTTPTHVDVALYGCGNNLQNAFLGIDCVAEHYWNVGTTAQSAWAAAQVNTTLSASVMAGATAMSVANPASISGTTVLTVDSGANQENVTTSCSGVCANPVPVTAFMNNHASSVNVIGAILQCTDIAGHAVDPYDDRMAWLMSALYNTQPPTPNPISIDDTVAASNSFTNHWNNSLSGDGGGAVTMANEAFEYGDQCGGGAGVNRPKLKMSDNLVSSLFIIAIDAELQGTSYPAVVVDGTAMPSLQYNWHSPGTTVAATACPSKQCTEPADHVNEYPVIEWDRGYTIPSCLTGAPTPGAFLEIDPSPTNTTLVADPNLDSARLAANARFDHLATTATSPPGSSVQLGKWIDGSSRLDGRPFLFVVNGGDCQQNSAPAFRSSFAWQSGNVLAVNDEDPFVDVGTCNNALAKEPKRTSGSAQFALNSETIFESNHVAWQNETSCPQNKVAGPAGGTSVQNNGGGAGTCGGTPPANCAGGLDDVSLRYWIIGNEMLFADYRYGWSRHNLIGEHGVDPNALDALGEDFIVALDPVTSVLPYSPGPGSTPNPSGNGCTGNDPNYTGGGTYDQDTGGIKSVAIAGSCGSSGSAAGAFFQNSPVVSQQWRECYVHGAFVGPCAAVGNYTTSSYQDMTTGLTKTFGTELVPYAHILDLNDTLGGTGPCPEASANSVGGPGVSACAQDVFEGGGQYQPSAAACIPSSGPIAIFNQTCLDVSDYSQEQVYNSDSSQTPALACTQGVASGVLTVCPKEYVILFR